MVSGKLCIARLIMIIAMREGFYHPGSLAQRCHNPGMLVFVGQPLARLARGPHGFACFDTDEAGWDALQSDVEAKRARGSRLRRAWTYLKEETI